MENVWMKNVLLTGHKGFIGSNLLPKLKDHNVSTIDLQDGKDLLTCDLPDDIDCVIHLAALSNEPLGELSHKLTEEINFEATINLA